MSIRRVIDWAIQGAEEEKVGRIASPFYQLYDDSQGWMWACDVDVGDVEVLRCVPVATNNRDIFYAEEGKAVMLRRLNNARWVITGLAKSLVSTKHIMYVCFTEDLAEIVGDETIGYLTRPLTYGELGDLAEGGYGDLPYGARGRFTTGGELMEILEA